MGKYDQVSQADYDEEYLKKENLQAGGFFSNVKLIVVLAVFVVIVLLEMFGGEFLFIATILLALFGFLHLFSGNSASKLILGIIPIALALFSLPEIVGGAGFGDIIGKIPFIGYLSPRNAASWFRYVLLAGIFVFYYFFMPSARGYTKMGLGASKAAGNVAAAGTAYAWKNFSLGRMLALLFIVAAIYGLENYSSVAGFDIPQNYGPYIVSVFLIILGLILVFRKNFTSILMGLVLILLGIVGFYTVFPLISDLTNNQWLGGLVPWKTSYIRYGLIAVIVFYFLFKGKSWAQTQVS